MERLHKFRCLPSPYRHLLVKSLLLLGLVRVGVWLLPFQTLRRLLAHVTHAHAASPEGDQASMRQVVWAVTVASRYVPAATCLTQALATQVLLSRSRRSHPSDLRKRSPVNDKAGVCTSAVVKRIATGSYRQLLQGIGVQYEQLRCRRNIGSRAHGLDDCGAGRIRL